MEKLKAKKREELEKGKKFSKKIRKDGPAPATIYGGGKEPVSISIDAIEYTKLIANSEYHRNQLISLQVDDNHEDVITRFVDRNLINNQLIHIDFIRIEKSKKLNVEIPVKPVGHSKGERLGGVLIQAKRKVNVECLPSNIPVAIDADINHLDIGDSFRAKDLQLNEELSLKTNINDIFIKVESTKVSKQQAEDSSQEVSENGNGAESKE